MSHRHLSRDRLLALVESPAPPEDPHLDDCQACRAEVMATRRLLDEVRALDVPEPSPLFWSHLSRRIHEAVAVEPRPSDDRLAWGRWLAWASPLAVAVTLAILLTARVDPPARTPGEGSDRTAAQAEPIADPDWQLLIAILGDGEDADDMAAAAAAALVPAGSSEALVAHLSREERAVLVRLLRQELGT